MINDLIFADAVFECQISHKKCLNNGECSKCLIAAYYLSLDDEKCSKVWDDNDL